MAKRYGGQTYRGRQGSSPFLKGLVIFLAVLLLAAVVFLIWSSRYLQYTDDGTKLELPWLQEQPGQPAAPDLSDLVITGERDPGEPPTAEPDPSPEPTMAVIRALEVDAADIPGGTAASKCAAAGADALLVQVKDMEGNLVWRSGLDLAQDGMNGDNAFNQAAAGLSRTGVLHMTARLTGFQDLWTTVYIRDMAILSNSGKLWYDHPGYSWLSLSNAAAREYITDLCVELAEMGFDEILLEHAGWPDQGRLQNIAVGDRYPAEGREQTAAAYLLELSGTLSAHGAVLSVQLEEAEPDDGSRSGLTPAALAGISGRVWLSAKADPEVWLAALSQAGMEDAGRRLVVPEPLDEGISWNGSRLLAG